MQLCFRASVCHLTDCRAAANLSGASWLESRLLLLPASDGKDGSPTPSSKMGSKENEEEKKNPTTTHKLVYTEQAWCSDSLSSSSKCVQFLISILPQWHSSKRGMCSCRYERRQPSRPNLPIFRREEEHTLNSRAVPVNYWGPSVIKHPSTSQGYYSPPIPSLLFSGLIRICRSANNLYTKVIGG